MKTYEFDAIIKGQELIDGAFIEFPYVVEEEFGTKGRVKVAVTFDGYEYRGSLVKMGHTCHILGITQKIRKEINKQPGEIVHVVLKKDEEPRVVEVPEDLQEELNKNIEAAEFFKSLSYTNQKKFVSWILSAKKAETRSKRIMDTIFMLKEKEVRP
ncbi:YdeI/OmpD-associated family protein [Clostridium cellulovorans]|uniref:DUF1905 domain-containing protein n=1 Tax=Clostridium cellulovorans (strain ATCC 35296 / DSM 3052 / OCM 3 / 743B) TaxID=573061 RepID=D9SVU7_CLOC7|nr:YdeI/OmpD-associated family protein [Clostridium cellulovorans]ADL53158.1 Domain of unknown function DUF1905 [Clostridium cellulovorans 743B]